jgi:S-DNA-T family DNA segregation ATPase FtsK/SpoIIIE
VPIGIDSDGPLMIDLVHDGPHILVAGTTGSGKSELLRTLITSLAATVDMQRVNFLLVDYKGGSAFDRCAAIPHTVGRRDRSRRSPHRACVDLSRGRATAARAGVA